jgi:CheY-like chemotaxis protein
VGDPPKTPARGFILVVEDDDDVRDEMRDALEERGYTVLEAEDGREALSILFADPAPDVRLIVSDLRMPRMSGTEMLQVLSSYSRSSRIPVVVVSVTQPPHLPKPHERAAEWVVKPFNMDELLQIVDSRFLPARAAP